MNNFSKIIHKNRDENSFTARLFEFELLPRWFKGNDDFLSFVDLLKLKSQNNYEYLIKKFPKTNIGFFETEEELVFKDAMLFLETRDIYSCVAKNVNKNNSNSFIEFDCIIVCENKIKEEIVICFEVKCYKNLENGEIENQFKWLEYLKSESLYKNYYHFALISFDNLKNAVRIFESENFGFYKDSKNGFFIITFEDLKDFLVKPRFSSVDLKLPRQITNKGILEPDRSLLDLSKSDI